MAKKKKSKVYIVEDHPIMREGIAQIVEQEECLEVCGHAEDATSGLRGIVEKSPDLAIVDISLKNSNGLDLVKNLQKHLPHLPILVLSMYDEMIYAQRALKAGALGYLMKHEKSDLFLEAIQRVLSGEIYVSEKIGKTLLYQSFRGKNQEDMGVEILSDRELEIFRLLGEGLTTKQIAEKLYLSTKTVETYKERMKEKLNLKTTSDLTQFAIQWSKKEKE